MRKPPDKTDNKPERPTYKTLVCFAVKQEAEGYEHSPKKHPTVGTLITGMGGKNAEQALRKSIAKHRPQLVLCCGFAGGLNPYMERGTVLFVGGDARLESRLLGAGALAGNFHHVDHVITTAAEKKALYEATHADLVDMESKAIATVCEEEKIPYANVRVVLDTADEDLPLDFNKLMNKKQRLSRVKIAMVLLKSPKTLFVLRKFKKKVNAAAAALTKVLVNTLPV